MKANHCSNCNKSPHGSRTIVINMNSSENRDFPTAKQCNVCLRLINYSYYETISTLQMDCSNSICCTKRSKTSLPTYVEFYCDAIADIRILILTWSYHENKTTGCCLFISTTTTTLYNSCCYPMCQMPEILTMTAHD